MAKNRVISYLTSNANVTGHHEIPAEVYDHPTFVPRLSYKHVSADLDEGDLYDTFTSLPNSGVAFFLDNNLWDWALEHSVWPGLLSREGGVYVIPHVRLDLEPWKQANPDFIGCKAIDEQKPPLDITLDLPSSANWEMSAYVYYASLLQQRRRALDFYAGNFARIHGRTPTDDEVVQGVQQLYGQRALSLVRKYGKNTPPGHRATDESLVYLAAVHGLQTGETTVVLTQDQDVFEQFYKLWWFLDTHYRSFLMAKEFNSSPDSYRVVPIPKTAVTTNVFHLGDTNLVEFGPRRMKDVLPNQFHFVSQECWLLGKSGRQLTRLVFGAETEMSGLLRVKGETGGLVSADLGGRNLHSYLGGTLLDRVDPSLVHNYVAVSRDKTLEVSNGLAKIAYLDITYALFSKEFVTRHVPRATG